MLGSAVQMLGFLEEKCSVVWRSKDRRNLAAGKNVINIFFKFVSGLYYWVREAVEKFKAEPQVSL